MKIAITGHRPNKLGNDYDLKTPWIERIKAVILNHVNNLNQQCELTHNLKPILITGMALGIDTLFAKIAIENNFQFIAAIPCRGQTSTWPAKSRKVWRSLVSHPLCVMYYISESPYVPWLMQKRNEWMVDNCDVLIAVWDGSNGGTAKCVKYAQKESKKIIFINPQDYESKH